MIDSSLMAATVTSITTAASTAGVAIVALNLNNKRFNSLEKSIDCLLVRIEAKIEKLDTSLDMLNGTAKELDKRLSVIEDGMFNRP